MIGQETRMRWRSSGTFCFLGADDSSTPTFLHNAMELYASRVRRTTHPAFQHRDATVIVPFAVRTECAQRCGYNSMFVHCVASI